MPISRGVPHGSVLGPLLFLLYINDLHIAIKFCKVHNFADDTNLLHISKSIKKLNTFVNFGLKNLSNWLNANKISLNVSKTELIMFKPRMKKVDFDLKLILNGKRLYPTKSINHLGIKIDESLTWNEHINDMVIKLNRANTMLYKVREFVNTRVQKLIYHAIFDCHLNYANTVWGQNKNSLNRLFLLQKKALRIISFECRNAHSNPLFYKHKIVKLHDKIIIENCLFISKSIKFHLSSIFSNWFTFSSDFHRYKTYCSLKGFLKLNVANTKKYGGEALISSAISSWNDIQKCFPSNKILRDAPTFKSKFLLKKNFLET